MNKPTITIIGAGLIGCFMAILLTKRGYKVHIYERSSREEVDNPISNKSFNMTFLNFGVKTFKDLGIWEDVEPITILLDGSLTQVKVNTKPIFSRVDKKSPFYTVTRTSMVKKLMHILQGNPLVTFHFDTALVALDRQKKTILVQNTKSQEYKTVTCDVIFGADGVNSQTRMFLQQAQDISHIQEYVPWGYKQFIIKKPTVDLFSWRRDISYTWTRKNATITSYPNEQQDFNAILILPHEIGFDSLQSEEQIKEFISKNFPDLLPALPDIVEGLQNNPEGYFTTIYTEPWYYKDVLVLLGDAAHGFMPFYGQGMSTGFGDCLELVQLIDNYGPDWEKIFPLYQKARKKHTDTLANLSKGAFQRYQRNTKADYSAIYDKWDTIFYKLFPKFFTPPPYVLVAYNPGKAADIVEKHQMQRRRGKFLGVPILISAITSLVALHEKLTSKH